MAYFRCQQGSSSGGAGAVITVTYDSSFYNKTMTCSNGTKTYTKTTTSSGSTTFSVAEGGTWTITCNGVSRTVDVVLEYSTQMAITKTVTVYSAASDTVSFTDVNGAKTVTTNTSGEGSVTITFIPNSTITFTSSYAKNPNNLSQAYSKTITMTDNITTIYVMPDGALYWWGNIVMPLSIINNTGVSISYMTNKMLFTANSGTMYKGGNLITDNSIALISSQIKLISGGGHGIYAGSISFGLSDLTAVTTIFDGSKYVSLPDNTLYSCNASASDKKISVNLKDGGATGSNTYIYIKALWYE